MEPKESYAVLKLGEANILGRVTSISTNELSFQSIFDDKIPMHSVQYMDVITSGKIHFRDLPVKVIADNHVDNEISFLKMLMREIKVTFDSSQVILEE